MLTPLLTHGKLEDVEKLLKCQEFWNFVELVLIKHPFIPERVRHLHFFKNYFSNEIFLIFSTILHLRMISYVHVKCI